MKINGWRRIFCILKIAVLCLFIASTGNSSEVNTKKQTKSLKKPTRNIDVAAALLDAGQAQHLMLNSHLSAFDWGDHGRPAGTYRGWSYVPSIFLSIGVPDGPWAPLIEDPITGEMVSMGSSVSGVCRYTLDQLDGRQSPDWGPKANSLGNLHSGEMSLGDIYTDTSLDDVPLVATSTYSSTWPKDENGYRYWPGMWAKDPNTGKIAIDTVVVSEFDFQNITLPWKFMKNGSEDTLLVGRFSADKEIYFEITDYDLDDQGLKYAEHDDIPEKGYALGVQVNFQGLSYGRSYAEDILFFPMQIINNSQWDYKDVYINLIDDSDVPEIITRSGSASVNDRMDWMTYISTEYDEENDTTYAYNMAYIYDWRWGGAADFPGPEYKVVPAFKLLDTPFAPEGHSHYSDGVDNDGDGFIDEPPQIDPVSGSIIDGEKLGITGWHWYQWENRPGEVETDRGEIIAYKLMAGDNTELTTLEEEAYFHASPDGILDPHFDSPAGIREEYPEGTDCMFEFSTGPFNLNAGDTVIVSYALVFGDDTTDVKFNARTAQFMYELNYQGADAPPPPNVTAVVHEDSITLYWDSISEGAVDIMTGYNDFEGYKIYRTTAPPNMNEWGDRIFDGNGSLVGFIPRAQFDISNSISNLDPIYPYLNRGTNSGLVHSWTDNNVKNGVTYWYSVTAYDRGVVDDPELNPDNWAPLNFLECAKGTNPNASPNLVEVVNGRKPINFVNSDMEIEALAGTYDNHTFIIKIIDPYIISGKSYLLSFDDTTSSQTTFSLKDEVSGEFVIENSSNINGQESPMIDGFTLAVNQDFSAVGFDSDSSEWFHGNLQTPGSTNWQFSGAFLVEEPYDFEIRFTDEADTAFFPPTFTIPFEIWNTTLNHKTKFAQFPPANPADTTDEMKNTWTSGDELAVQEIINGRPKFTIKMKLSAPPLQVLIDIDTTFVTADSMVFDTTTTITDTSIAPVTGDILQLITGKPFKGDRDFYRINTAPYTSREVTNDDLDNVKVVPNPYMLSAEWDIDQYNKQISFTNLPTECDIHVYTLSGERVITLNHQHDTEGWERWNMLSFNQQEIAYGCYIYVVETPNGKKKIGKFVILR